METNGIKLAQKAMERNILACILTDPDLLSRCHLPAAAFESDALRAAYTLTVDLRTAGHDPVTINTLRHFYDSRPDFQATVAEHGGWKFLENLALKPDTDNFNLHLHEMFARYEARVLRSRLVSAVKKLGEDPSLGVDDILKEMDAALNTEDLNSTAPPVLKAYSLDEDWLEAQSDAYERGEFDRRGIPLDMPLAAVCGEQWQNGILCIWAGETNVGKSQIVQMIVGDYGIKKSIPTLVLDNELTMQQYENRLLARFLDLDLSLFTTGRIFNRKHPLYAVIQEGIKRTKAAPVSWKRMDEMTIGRVEQEVRRFLRQFPKDQYPNKMLIVDGIKMTGNEDSMFSVGFFAQSLHDLANRYADEGLMIHATCQLNRGGAQSTRAKNNVNDHPSHTDVGLSKLIPDNADDFYILLHHMVVDNEGNKIRDKHQRRLICTKARDHDTTEGKDYLLMDFNGSRSLLRPHSLSSGTPLAADDSGKMPESLSPEPSKASDENLGEL